MTCSRPHRLDSGDWGSIYLSDTSALPSELVGATIVVQSRNGQSWTTTVTAVLERSRQPWVLDGPVQARRRGSPQARCHFTQADQVNQLVLASEADPDLGFMARMMALCSLPRTNPGDRIRYKRVNGPYTLYMTAGRRARDCCSGSPPLVLHPPPKLQLSPRSCFLQIRSVHSLTPPRKTHPREIAEVLRGV